MVRRLYELFWEGKVDEAFELVDPEIEWSEPPEGPGAAVVRGREAALRAIAEWMASWSDYELEVADVVDLPGERMLWHLRQRARGAMSGLDVESDLWHLWTLREGVPVRMQMFLTRENALRAAGSEG